MQDYSYFDEYTSEEPAPIHSTEQKMDEYNQLKEIADKIGSYRWQYKSDFANQEGLDTEEHLGITAQSLLEVPGLKGAVIPDENGVLTVDTNYISLATLGLVAALARIVLEDRKDELTNEEFFTNIQEPTSEAESGTAEVPSPTESATSESIGQPTVETEETTDNGNSIV